LLRRERCGCDSERNKDRQASAQTFQRHHFNPLPFSDTGECSRGDSKTIVRQPAIKIKENVVTIVNNPRNDEIACEVLFSIVHQPIS
jgi:hypothetical protein